MYGNKLKVKVMSKNSKNKRNVKDPVKVNMDKFHSPKVFKSTKVLLDTKDVDRELYEYLEGYDYDE